MGTKIKRLKTLTAVSQHSTAEWMLEPSSFIGTSVLCCPHWKSPQLPIHNEGWTVWGGDIKLPPPSQECLHAAIQDPITQLHWIRHKRFSFDARLAIDWDTCAADMQALQPAGRRWIAKHASSNCGVGKTLVKWKYQNDDRCPWC